MKAYKVVFEKAQITEETFIGPEEALEKVLRETPFRVYHDPEGGKARTIPAVLEEFDALGAAQKENCIHAVFFGGFDASGIDGIAQCGFQRQPQMSYTVESVQEVSLVDVETLAETAAKEAKEERSLCPSAGGQSQQVLQQEAPEPSDACDYGRVLRGTLTRRLREEASRRDGEALGNREAMEEAVAKTFIFDSLYDTTLVRHLIRPSRHNERGWGFRVDIDAVSEALGKDPYYEYVLRKVKGFTKDVLNGWYGYQDDLCLNGEPRSEIDFYLVNHDRIYDINEKNGPTERTILFPGDEAEAALVITYTRKTECS